MGGRRVNVLTNRNVHSGRVSKSKKTLGGTPPTPGDSRNNSCNNSKGNSRNNSIGRTTTGVPAPGTFQWKYQQTINRMKIAAFRDVGIHFKTKPFSFSILSRSFSMLWLIQTALDMLFIQDFFFKSKQSKPYRNFIT